MNSFAQIFGLSLIALVSGCATSYKSNGFTGGFSDTQLAPDVFRVVFHGNAYTSPERTQDFALLRAADLVYEHGFTCFAVVNDSNSTSVESFTTSGSARTTGTVQTYGNMSYYSGRTTYTPGQTYTFYKPQAGLLVRGFQVKPETIFTFDVAFLQQSIRQKYGIK